MTITKNRSTNGKTRTTDPNDVAESIPKKSRRSKSNGQPRKAAETTTQEGLKLAIAQAKLNEALAFVKAAVPTKPLHPVLANVLLVADQDTQQVKLTTSDMAISLSASCEATVQRSGAITLPAEILSAVVSRCPMWLLAIDTTQTEESYSAILSDEQGGITEIRGMSSEEFPEIAAVAGSPASLPAKVVQAGLKGVLFAVSTDETKRVLTGMEWKLNGSTLHCTATDGHQVAKVVLDTSGIGKKKRKVQTETASAYIIPGKALKELAKTLEKTAPETELLSYDDKAKRVLFAVEENDLSKQISCRCMEEDYPDCDLLLSRYPFNQTVTISRSTLLSRLERLAVLADKKVKTVKFSFDSQHQTIGLSIERDYGKGKQVLDAAIPETVNGMAIKFNITYLLNILKAMSSSALKLVMHQFNTPAKVEAAGDVDIPELRMEATYFLFPMVDQDEMNGQASSKEISEEQTTEDDD
jgi:DNA polymerase-3 subunit beta